MVLPDICIADCSFHSADQRGAENRFATNANVALMRLKKADRYARKRLTKSAVLLKQGETNRFYEELLGAVWGYLSDKLNIPLSALSRETARSALAGKIH